MSAWRSCDSFSLGRPPAEFVPAAAEKAAGATFSSTELEREREEEEGRGAEQMEDETQAEEAYRQTR